MSEELNENMTSEEIASYADSMVSQIKQERLGGEKSDASVVNSTAGSKPSKDSAVNDTPVVDDDRDSATDGETTGKSESSPSWVTDDVKAEVAAYGIGDDELLDFQSREELDRALRLIDKRAMKAGQDEVVKDDSPPRDESGKFAKKEDAKPEDDSSSSGYNVELSPDLYDDEIISEFSRMKDYYESRLQAIESRFVEAAADAEEQSFDRIVDSLGHSDLFGKTGKESKDELERRRELNVAVKAQVIGLQKLGHSADLNDRLVARVANMVFADELGKKRLKQQTSKIMKQSNLRQGGTSVRPTQASEDPREEADRLYREMERS